MCGWVQPKKKPTFPPAHPTSELLTSLELRSHVSPSSYRSERTEEKKKNTPKYTTNPVHIFGTLNHSHSFSHLLLLWRGSEQQASVNRERGASVPPGTEDEYFTTAILRWPAGGLSSTHSGED